MPNSISVNEVVIVGNSIECKYTVEGEWKRYFITDTMKVEYGIDVSGVPESIAVIPFIANILPAAWIFDAEITVRECDKDFYESISEFKKGYIAMYPNMEFLGKMKVDKIVENHVEGDGSICFFSGGVDAFNTLVMHAQNKPSLVTLWGADVKLSDSEGWQKVEDHIKITAEEFGTDYIYVKSEFRAFLKEWPLSVAVEKSGDGWWHGFQHGIGIICHAAPIAYVTGKKTIYFASSFTAKDKGKVKCASDPTIDNYVRFCGARVIHDGYEFDRQEKIHNIVEYSKANNAKIALRVCWESAGGSNCCKCEKCWRTILGVYAEGENPKDYGFEYGSFSELSKLIYSKRELLAWHRESRYVPVQNRMRSNYKLESIEPNLRWFYKMNLDKLQGRFERKKFVKRVKDKIRRTLKLK